MVKFVPVPLKSIVEKVIIGLFNGLFYAVLQFEVKITRTDFFIASRHF